MDTGDGTLELFVSHGSTLLAQTFIEGLFVDGTCPGRSAGHIRPAAGVSNSPDSPNFRRAKANAAIPAGADPASESAIHSVCHAGFAWSICGPDACSFRHPPGRAHVISAGCVAHSAGKSESQPANT